MSQSKDSALSDLVAYAVRLLAHGSPEEWNQNYRRRSFQDLFLPRTKDALLFDFKYEDRHKFYQCVNERYVKKAPIDYLEFGVAGGDSIRHWLRLNSNVESRFFGFDSFEGLPEDWHSNAPKGTFSRKGSIPQIDDSRVKFIKGLFQKSLPQFLESFFVQNRLVVHFDSDLYSSTLYTMVSLDKFITSGNIFVFDEFTARGCTDEYAALHDYCIACYRDYKVLCGRKDFAKIAIEIV